MTIVISFKNSRPHSLSIMKLLFEVNWHSSVLHFANNKTCIEKKAYNITVIIIAGLSYNYLIGFLKALVLICNLDSCIIHAVMKCD